MWTGPQNVGKQRPQNLVGLKFDLNLPKECLCDGARVRKDPDCDLRVVQYVLNGQTKSDQRALAVFATPKIEIAIRCRLHLATPSEIPIAIEVSPPQYIH